MNAPRHENKILFLRLAKILGPIILGIILSKTAGDATWAVQLQDHWAELLMLAGVAVYGWDKAKYTRAMNNHDADMAALRNGSDAG